MSKDDILGNKKYVTATEIPDEVLESMTNTMAKYMEYGMKEAYKVAKGKDGLMDTKQIEAFSHQLMINFIRTSIQVYYTVILPTLGELMDKESLR